MLIMRILDNRELNMISGPAIELAFTFNASIQSIRYYIVDNIHS